MVLRPWSTYSLTLLSSRPHLTTSLVLVGFAFPSSSAIPLNKKVDDWNLRIDLARRA
jgi:hypothetical protein